jgi:hypothetical protein
VIPDTPPSIAAMEFGLKGLPRSLRWPCASSSAEMARRLHLSALGLPAAQGLTRDQLCGRQKPLMVLRHGALTLLRGS